MRRIILSVCMLAFLVSGIEIAADIEEAMETGLTTVQFDLGLGEQGDESDMEICDHCCHANSHFSGAVSTCLIVVQAVSSTRLGMLFSSYNFPRPVPPTPPPIV